MSYTINRVLVKSFVWRIIATLTGATITWLLTGELETAGKFIIIEFPLKMMIYYIHETGWGAIRWGRTTTELTSES